MNEDRVFLLLQICDYANQWAPLRPLHDVAMMELVELAQDAKEELARRAESLAKAKAEDQARADARAKAQAEMATPRAIPASAVAPAPVEPPPTPPMPDEERRV